MTTDTPNPRRIAYARVSTVDQVMDGQLNALKAAGYDLIFSDHGISGAKRSRPALDQALATLRAGDILLVWRLDRLGRSLRDLIDIVEGLEKRGCHFESLSDRIDTSSASGRLIFHLLAALAEFERQLASKRTKLGLEAARRRGVRLGRPPAGGWQRDQKRRIRRHASGKSMIRRI